MLYYCNYAERSQKGPKYKKVWQVCNES